MDFTWVDSTTIGLHRHGSGYLKKELLKQQDVDDESRNDPCFRRGGRARECTADEAATADEVVVVFEGGSGGGGGGGDG